MSVTDQDQAGRYLLDNAGSQASSRFASLETSYDGLTQAYLADRGVGPGWRCLEVGAGSGSVARWLAGKVGPEGSVLATDIDPRWVDTGGLPQVQVAQHDIVADPLPSAEFNLIHARLVLVHLPARQAILARLAGALKPDGWLVIEEFDSSLPHCLDPLDDRELAFAKVMEAFIAALHTGGADTTYPRTLPHRLRAVGLVDVGAAGHVTIYSGGSPESALQKANLDQVGPSMVEVGLVTEQELGVALDLLQEPTFVANHPLMVTAWGRRSPDHPGPGDDPG
jgi:SAM-dependent methyltransferase